MCAAAHFREGRACGFHRCQFRASREFLLLRFKTCEIPDSNVRDFLLQELLRARLEPPNSKAAHQGLRDRQAAEKSRQSLPFLAPRCTMSRHSR